MLLYGVICQVYESIECLGCVLITRRSDIPLFVVKTLHTGIERCHQSKTSDVKFSPMQQERPFNVFLDNKCVVALLVDDCADGFQGGGHCYP